MVCCILKIKLHSLTITRENAFSKRPTVARKNVEGGMVQDILTAWKTAYSVIYFFFATTSRGNVHSRFLNMIK